VAADDATHRAGVHIMPWGHEPPREGERARADTYAAVQQPGCDAFPEAGNL
jgi:hypothetical protein